jgi:Zn-dependent protease with chaperone function
MTSTLVALTLVALVAPHLLDQSRLPPAAGIALWLAVLSLRAAVAVVVAAIFLLLLPATELFRVLTHWCLHAVLPLFATHLGFDGHKLGGAATVVPAAFLAISLLSAGFGIWRGARTVRRWLKRSAVGNGPQHSVIVGGRDVLVAAAGVRTPRVVVSAGALVRLDDDELAAGLEHERGHIARRHRFVSMLGRLLHGISRPIPAGELALERLHFQLERDADEFAVRRTGDPLALAGAISKAATGGANQPALAQLGGCRTAERLRLLLAGGRRSKRAWAGLLANGLAVATATLALTWAASVPALAQGDLDRPVESKTHAAFDCRS